jgi:hypothetical protein
MKASTALLFLLLGTGACASQATRQAAGPPSTRPAPVAAAPIAQLETAPVRESTPPSSGIPDSPQVAPPKQSAAPSTADTPLTPASAVGEPRPVPAAASLVQSGPARDKADSAADQESIQEIRALLAADTTLSVPSSQVTILVRNGRVWLRGQVNTAQQRTGIERAARRAGGVLDVKNELVVME